MGRRKGNLAEHLLGASSPQSHLIFTMTVEMNKVGSRDEEEGKEAISGTSESTGSPVRGKS